MKYYPCTVAVKKQAAHCIMALPLPYGQEVQPNEGNAAQKLN
jgi:hypothetical protein